MPLLFRLAHSKPTTFGQTLLGYDCNEDNGNIFKLLYLNVFDLK